MRIKIKYSFLALLFLLIASCSKPDSPSTIQFRFKHTVDTFQLEQYDYYQNAANNNYNVVRLRYFISKMQLVDSYGDTVSLGAVHFVDIDKTETLSIAAQSIPNRKYKKLCFTIGLNEELNVHNAYLNESYHSAMLWPDIMGGGYHYMKLEGFYDVADDSRSYNLHTGKLDDNHNYIPLVFDADFSASGSDVVVDLNMDVNQWFANPNLYNLEEQPASIMGNLVIQHMLKENAHNVFTISYE